MFVDWHGSKNNTEVMRRIRWCGNKCGGCDFGLDFIVFVCVEI